MGKGLSELQQDIIVMAYKNKEAGVVAYRTGANEYNTHPVVSAHVRRSTILREHFGWEPGGPRRYLRDPSECFSKKDIGAKHYNSVMASLSRALHRLEKRGVVEFTHSMLAGGWSGVELTEEGEAEAQRVLRREPTRPRPTHPPHNPLRRARPLVDDGLSGRGYQGFRLR